MIQELHSRDFKSVLQAREEGNVNDIQEAYGFSFMIAPEVKWKAKVEKQKEDLFTFAVLETRGFVSKARIKGITVAGKTVSTPLRSDEVPIFEQWLANSRRLDDIVDQMHALGLRAAAHTIKARTKA